MIRKLTTESTSLYDHLEKMKVGEILKNINNEDAKVARTIQLAIPQIEELVNAVLLKMMEGGRLFYIGSGTSGRLGVVDASECPPTFGVSQGLIVGLIAGGDGAIREAVEFAEDDLHQGWEDLISHKPTEKDTLIGIAASGNTPYVIGALIEANKNGLLTGCIVCNESAEMARVARYPIEVVVGPEFVTGSTRMKAGTAQKLVLNMISTSLMIKLGRVAGNKMVDMQLSNKKLMQRGVEMLMEKLSLSRHQASEKLSHYGSVRKVIDSYNKKS